ncbi:MULTISPECIES: type VI secretion system ImpA family N-terminal domain-containing protein [unclassified Vibrio]|uniref:type VI secretion system ImpA family N-terminal domain-containing protein n=1 Tax=unclassified Vibrio TaxID=2614977 RepID=UPI001361AA40|nr:MULTISPECIES: type VI secretion system ImpA family N-terminal domain-containing protein [unclassified Vibrio]NAW56190.1 type VI secretion protein [Vibrio sp. V36_P2S2PM302]NAX26750.1 type VI secretion protein [Vibrio sp. V38_P2S17PM301]NAX29959.1 type VI secretion protein [Vibrio sp. V37_P2S8PM304]
MYFSDFARRPIDHEHPSGINPNGLEEFDEIKRQINNINKVTGRVSWKKVEELSKQVLTQHGKDFRCACYFGVAATNNHGLKGLVEGLNAIYDLCVVYWHSGYPTEDKANARMSSIEWFVEYAERRQKHINPSEQDLPLIEAGHRLTLKIEEELRLHYGIKAPSLGAIRRIFTQWIEQLKTEMAKREEAVKQQTASVAQPAPAPRSQPMMKMDVLPSPSPTSATPVNVSPSAASEPEKKRSGMGFFMAALAVVILVALFSHFVYQDRRVEAMKTQIEIASINQLVPLANAIKLEDNSTKQAIKDTLLQRVSALVNGWDLDPIRVSQIDDIGSVTQTVTELYPDSSSAQSLSATFEQSRADLEAEYQKLSAEFKQARTVFANAKAKNNDKASIERAYRYSNTLFPLLGRIEYAAQNQMPEEVAKSQRLLNIYQHKLNELKVELQQEQSATAQ